MHFHQSSERINPVKQGYMEQQYNNYRNFQKPVKVKYLKKKDLFYLRMN